MSRNVLPKKTVSVYVEILCLTKTHIECYSQLIKRNKDKNGKAKGKPVLEMRSCARAKIPDVKSVKTKTEGKKRMLQMVTEGKATFEESNKDGKEPWLNMREKLYCLAFRSNAKTVSQCKAIISAQIKKRK